jgi:SAM-dependent methyltransferase
VSSIWNRISRPLREARWRLARWSPASDRQFHDDTFAPQQHDPFSLSYPGYLTIRRFADLAGARLDGVRSVVDLGCGPGEITCELARRYPQIEFLGVDHSTVGLGLARSHAERLGLANVRFEAGDLDTFSPRPDVDLVAMFDAFHHLQNPPAFLARTACPRLFLIEPAGAWTGQWDRSHDLDWLAATIFQMSDRIEYQFGGSEAAVPPGPQTPAAVPRHDAAGEPTEHRYTVEDFERFFEGYSLDFRGTIAGLEQHGPRPRHSSALRARMAQAGYELLVAVEDTLHQSGLDLAAKHWAIYAERGGAGAAREPRVPQLPPRRPMQALIPAYGMRVERAEGPDAARCGEIFQVAVRIANTGWRVWGEADAEPIRLSYHWLDADGRTIVHDGLRTTLAASVPQGASADAVLQVAAPGVPGKAILALDLVHEGVTWFSEQGVPPHQIPVRIASI